LKILCSGLQAEITLFGVKLRAELILVEYQKLELGPPENPGHDVYLDTGFSLGLIFCAVAASLAMRGSSRKGLW
jgi:hypothetical protein